MSGVKAWRALASAWAVVALAGCVDFEKVRGDYCARNPQNCVGDGGEAALAVDRASFDFGGVQVGAKPSARFILSNTGGRPAGAVTAALSGSGAWAFSAPDLAKCQNLAVGSTCAFEVGFAPALGQSFGATLNLEGGAAGSAAIALAGTGVAVGNVTITPTDLDFGAVVKPASSPSKIFLVKNTASTATGNLSTTLGGSDGSHFAVSDDTCSGQSLAPNATCTLSLRFSPGTAGPKQASLLVNGTPGGSALAAVRGTGLTSAALGITPTDRDLGSVFTADQSSPVTFQVTNTGAAATGPLIVTSSGTYASEFPVADTASDCAGISLQPQKTCSVAVRFAPSSEGDKVGSVMVSAEPGVAASATLSGVGVKPATLIASPEAKDFGDVLAGSTASATIHFTNSGQVATSPLVTSLDAADGGEFAMGSTDTCSNQALASGAACDVEVVFQPGSPGAKSASLGVQGTTGGGAAVALTGTATPRPAALTVSTPSFGSILIGTNVTQAVTIENTGDLASGPISWSISGPQASEFETVAPTGTDCALGTTTLAGGAQCTFQVRWTAGARYTRSATLTVTGTPGGSPTVTLSGIGLKPATLSSAETSMTFPTQELGTTWAAQTWTVTNDGDLATGVPNITKGGPYPSEFIATGCSLAISPGGNCTVSITFSPITTGTHPATIFVNATPGGSVLITASGSSQARLTVTIVGTGTVASSVGGINCSSGSCSALVSPGGVTLRARPTNGSGFYFGGWSDALCPGVFHDCTFPSDLPRMVTATFVPLTNNLVFMSSATYAHDLGPTGYDGPCNTLATAAGINSATNNAFVAWVSSSTQHASARVGSSARGFIRMDGLPIADQLTDLLSAGGHKIFHPVVYDEMGLDPGPRTVMTGTTSNGSLLGLGDLCNDWSTVAAPPAYYNFFGNSTAGPHFWTQNNRIGCDTPSRIYCFMKTKTAALTPAVNGGKKIWVTTTAYSPIGAQTPTAKCTAEKPSTVVSAKALLATTTTPASAALSPSQQYVRPDGQVVGTYAELVAAGPIRTGIWQDATGAYLVGGDAWTGYLQGGPLTATASTLGTTCNDWTNASGSVYSHAGSPWRADGLWWASIDNASCGSSRRLICVEQ